MLNTQADLAPRAHTNDTARMRDLARPLDPDASGYARIMAVFGAVAAHGPMTLETTMERTGLPRSACWRCLTTLEAEGWIRRRLQDGAFLTSAAAHMQLGASPPNPPFIEVLIPHVTPLVRKARVEADIAQLSAEATLQTLETTHKAAQEIETFFASPLTLAVLMVCPPDIRLNRVNAALVNAPPEDRSAVTSGRFTRALAQAAAKGEVWRPDEGSLTVPLEAPGIGVAALRLEGHGRTKRTENKLRGLVEALRKACPDLMPTADTIASRHWPARRPSPLKR